MLKFFTSGTLVAASLVVGSVKVGCNTGEEVAGRQVAPGASRFIGIGSYRVEEIVPVAMFDGNLWIVVGTICANTKLIFGSRLIHRVMPG